MRWKLSEVRKRGKRQSLQVYNRQHVQRAAAKLKLNIYNSVLIISLSKLFQVYYLRKLLEDKLAN